MPSAINLSGDIIGSSVALAGLILVFLGAISTSFDSYQKQEQNSVRARYQRRAWFAFVGFCLALLAAALALFGKWFASECVAILALALILIAFGWVVAVALISVLEIK